MGVPAVHPANQWAQVPGTVLGAAPMHCFMNFYNRPVRKKAYLFPKPAVTDYHKFSGPKDRFIILQFWRKWVIRG